VLMLLGFFVPLGLLVTEFAEVHDVAYGWGCIGRNFDQVHSGSAGQV